MLQKWLVAGFVVACVFQMGCDGPYRGPGGGAGQAIAPMPPLSSPSFDNSLGSPLDLTPSYTPPPALPTNSFDAAPSVTPAYSEPSLAAPAFPSGGFGP